MKVYIITGQETNLFGIHWIMLFNLWRKPIKSFCRKLIASSVEKANHLEKFANEVKSKFKEVSSEGPGCYNKTELMFELKDKVKPVFKARRKVPLSSLEFVENELQRLEDIGVIKKVDYSDWASPMVYMKKRNKLRICADFSAGLNNCIKDHSYPLPALEDIFSKLNGGKNLYKNRLIKSVFTSKS